MSNLDLQMAKALYREFIDSFSTSQARFVPLYARALPFVHTIQVSRQAMLERFLTENAKFEPHPKQLSGTCPELPEFPVAKHLWEPIKEN
jgi:hypothetical protein